MNELKQINNSKRQVFLNRIPAVCYLKLYKVAFVSFFVNEFMFTSRQNYVNMNTK